MSKQHEARNQIHPLTVLERANASALAFVFLLSLFINLSMLALPVYSMQIFDRVITSGNVNTLIYLTAIAAFFVIIYGVLDYARSGVLLRAGKASEQHLREHVFDASFSAAASPGHVQRAMSDVRAMCEVLTAGVASTVFDLFWTPLFVLLCYLVHPTLGIIAGASVVVLFGLALANELVTSGWLKVATDAHADAGTELAGTFQSIEAARGLGMGATLRGRWLTVMADGDQATAIASERAAGFQALSKLSRLLVQICLMGAGAMLAIQGEISPSVMIAASIIMGRALAPVEQIVGHWKRIVAYRGARDRLRELLAPRDGAGPVTELPGPVGKLNVENAAICLEAGQRPTVMGVSFDLDPGTSLAIVGASGSGKSTLARSLVGALRPSLGSIRLDGATYDQWTPDRLGRHLGYLPQSVELLQGSIAENIARFTNSPDADIVAAAREAGVHDAILRLPDGYRTQLGPGGLGISGGMRQRVALARAVFGGPCLVVLDEPNANLDEEGERELVANLKRMKAAGRTVVLVTHRPQILRTIDNILVMNQGRQIAFGPTADVVARMRGGKVAAV